LGCALVYICKREGCIGYWGTFFMVDASLFIKFTPRTKIYLDLKCCLEGTLEPRVERLHVLVGVVRLLGDEVNKLKKINKLILMYKVNYMKTIWHGYSLKTY